MEMNGKNGVFNVLKEYLRKQVKEDGFADISQDMAGTYYYVSKERLIKAVRELQEEDYKVTIVKIGNRIYRKVLTKKTTNVTTVIEMVKEKLDG